MQVKVQQVNTFLALNIFASSSIACRRLKSEKKAILEFFLTIWLTVLGDHILAKHVLVSEIIDGSLVLKLDF